MENNDGQVVDLYIPRKCSVTNRIIDAKDHAAVQLRVGKVDDDGVFTGEAETFALSGGIRAQGSSDAATNRLCVGKGFMKDV